MESLDLEAQRVRRSQCSSRTSRGLILFHTLNHYRRKCLNVRMVKESEEILKSASASGPQVPEHITGEDMLAALVPFTYQLLPS